MTLPHLKKLLASRFQKLSQNKDFGLRSPAKTQRDKKAESSFNPPRLLTGSSTRILKYVEDLKRDSNAEIGPKDYFEMPMKKLPSIAKFLLGASPNTYSCSPRRCHIIMHLIVGVPISFTASPVVGHISNRITPKHQCFPDKLFDLVKYSMRT
jgi:hypothetical protein